MLMCRGEMRWPTRLTAEVSCEEPGAPALPISTPTAYESRSAVCWRGLGGVDGQRKVFNIPLPILSIGRWARGHTRVRPAAVGLALLQGGKVQEGRREEEQDGTHREAVQT